MRMKALSAEVYYISLISFRYPIFRTRCAKGELSVVAEKLNEFCRNRHSQIVPDSIQPCNVILK